MKPFRFRLERLKQLRTQELDRERASMDRAQEACDAWNAELRERADEQRRREQALEARLEDGMTGASLRGEAANTQQGANAVVEAASELEGAEERRAENQDQLFAAWRRMRLLERLEARGRSRHARAEERRAQKTLDETGQLRWWDRNR